VVGLFGDCGCGSKDYYLKVKAHNVGAYCVCGKWIKWVGKKDVEALQRRGVKVHSENYAPSVKAIESKVGVKDLGVKPDLGVITTLGVKPELVIKSDVSENKQESVVKKVCRVCDLGDLLALEEVEGYTISVFEGVLSIIRGDNKIVASYKLDFCPGCGKKLG